VFIHTCAEHFDLICLEYIHVCMMYVHMIYVILIICVDFSLCNLCQMCLMRGYIQVFRQHTIHKYPMFYKHLHVQHEYQLSITHQEKVLRVYLALRTTTAFILGNLPIIVIPYNLFFSIWHFRDTSHPWTRIML